MTIDENTKRIYQQAGGPGIIKPEIKEALLLSMVHSGDLISRNAPKIKPNIHIMLFGDPSN